MKLRLVDSCCMFAFHVYFVFYKVKKALGLIPLCCLSLQLWMPNCVCVYVYGLPAAYMETYEKQRRVITMWVSKRLLALVRCTNVYSLVILVLLFVHNRDQNFKEKNCCLSTRYTHPFWLLAWVLHIYIMNTHTHTPSYYCLTFQNNGHGSSSSLLLCFALVLLSERPISERKKEKNDWHIQSTKFSRSFLLVFLPSPSNHWEKAKIE